MVTKSALKEYRLIHLPNGRALALHRVRGELVASVSGQPDRYGLPLHDRRIRARRWWGSGRS